MGDSRRQKNKTKHEYQNDDSTYTEIIFFSCPDSKQPPLASVAMETLAAAGPSYGCTGLLSTVVYCSYPCQEERQPHCCHTLLQMP